MIHDCVEISEVMKRSKGHFFSEGAMRFFSSRTSQLAWPFKGGYLFWTSERHVSDRHRYPRLYSVRYQNSDGLVGTIGEFQEHVTAVRAMGVIKTILARGEFPLRLKEAK